MPNTFLKANWENLVMANYEVDPAVLKPYLPKGVELDYYNFKTYVSLVGFMFKKTSLFGIPIPFFGSFEEINLRFYVQRLDGKKVKKGVVFINETVPFKIVALLANKLYKEHYISIPTKHKLNITDKKEIKYEWKINQKWNSISVYSDSNKYSIRPNSMEEFIFERYFGFTKIDENRSQEYRINHPKWVTNEIQENEINCDFAKMYGDAFANLTNRKPDTVLLAEGSSVNVNWKRTIF
jgi:uncharacterized protein YqjF (DUF2071 family)